MGERDLHLICTLNHMWMRVSCWIYGHYMSRDGLNHMLHIKDLCVFKFVSFHAHTHTPIHPSNTISPEMGTGMIFLVPIEGLNLATVALLTRTLVSVTNCARQISLLSLLYIEFFHICLLNTILMGWSYGGGAATSTIYFFLMKFELEHLVNSWCHENLYMIFSIPYWWG